MNALLFAIRLGCCKADSYLSYGTHLIGRPYPDEGCVGNVFRSTKARLPPADNALNHFRKASMISNDSTTPPGANQAPPLTLKQRINIAFGIAWGLVVVAGMVGALDRLYWVNADTYPSWRAEDLTITREMAKSDKSYGSICVEGHAELREKQNGNFIRCAGNLFAFKTYRVTNYEQMSAWIWEDVREVN